MRRFLSTSFIVLALVVSTAGAAPAAHAATCLPGYSTDLNRVSTNPDNSECTPDASSGTSANADTTTATNTDCLASSLHDANGNCIGDGAATPGGVAAANTPTPFEGSPKMDGVFAQVMGWILSLFAWLLTAAMITLNYAVYYTVIKMGDYVNGLAAIGVTWRILRDIANIMFIFGFLGAGIATILNVDQYGWKTKMLPMLLIGAIFLNFSLFITEAMIDGTNLFATQFYTQINGGKMPTADTLLNGKGISDKIMQQLGLQQIYGGARTNPQALAAGNSVFVAFMGIILFIVTAFVMFSLAFILIARFVALIFFIILCPVGFMGLALPMMQYRAGQWWKNFLEQIITAPVLLLLLYIALAVITDAQFLAFGTAPNWLGLVPNAIGGNSAPVSMAGFAGMLLSFLIAMGLLLVVVIKAKSMSAFGADGAIKLGGKLSFGATAFGLRTTAGWGSQGAAQALRRTKFGATKYGRVLTTTLDKGAKASFDIRGATIGGGLKGIGVEAGDAQKGGYRARRDAAIKGHQEYAKSIGEAIDEKGLKPEEEKAIADAEAAQTIAKSAFEHAEREYKAAQAQLNPQIALQEAEVARLKEEQRVHMERGGLPDPETEQKLGIAQQQLKASQGNLGVETAKHGRAASAADVAEKAVAAANKASGDRIGSEKRNAQLAYAKDIRGSFPGWVMYGPGGSVAARKIKTDAKKSPDKILLDNLKKAIAAGEKSDTTTPAAPAPTAAKPAATTP